PAQITRVAELAQRRVDLGDGRLAIERLHEDLEGRELLRARGSDREPQHDLAGDQRQGAILGVADHVECPRHGHATTSIVSGTPTSAMRSPSTSSMLVPTGSGRPCNVAATRLEKSRMT